MHQQIFLLKNKGSYFNITEIIFYTLQAAWNKSTLLLKNTLQNTQTLQLFTKNFKTESFIKVIKNTQLCGLDDGT
jgi:hypothetical protein